ncbi:MAG: MoxR family ATPase [Deltaproteobacteria bacterium]|jgi:MoxR-like ATPase|nr:MoxR family ATPase [Deltaproteobacteria bacterium]
MTEAKNEGGLEIQKLADAAKLFTKNVGRVIVGKEEPIQWVFIGLLCGGHLLIEDVPGVGKTLLAKAAARSLGCTFKRIQCTPDLLPADVTGLHYFNQKISEFEFRPGPILANLVLVDEINRAMPRTQSCLLECMQEHQVTVDWHTFSLPRPFLILATQNPIELEGTFPLPEAQLDRFLLRVRLGYPSAAEEETILFRFQETNPLDSLPVIFEAKELLDLQRLSRQVYVEPTVRGYITTLTRATRSHADIRLGASPRSSLALHSAAQARAAIQGRNYVIPDDVKSLFIPVIAHRLLIKAEARMRGKTEEDVLMEILEQTSIPLEEPA